MHAKAKKAAAKNGTTYEFDDIAKVIGDRWRALSDDEKENWNERARGPMLDEEAERERERKKAAINSLLDSASNDENVNTKKKPKTSG